MLINHHYNSHDFGFESINLVDVLFLVESGLAEDWKIIIGVLVTAVVVLMISIILCLLYRQHLKKSYAKYLEPNKNYQVRIIIWC